MLLSRLQDRLFGLMHGNRLIYNACWEDPRIDRALLGLGPDSTVVAITSAGCNVLDYLLDGPAAIQAVDVNFRQNAILSLKMALLRTGSPGPRRFSSVILCPVHVQSGLVGGLDDRGPRSLPERRHCRGGFS